MYMKAPFVCRQIIGTYVSENVIPYDDKSRLGILMAELPGLDGFRIHAHQSGGKGFTIRTDLSASQARQYGYAAAEFSRGIWTVKQHGEGQYVLHNSITREAYRVSDGGMINAFSYSHHPENGMVKVPVRFLMPSVKKWNAGLKQWGSELPMTRNIRAMTNIERTSPITAWTWKHILARALNGEPVIAVHGPFDHHVVDGYRKQLWRNAEYDSSSFPHNVLDVDIFAAGEHKYAIALFTVRRGRTSIPLILENVDESLLLAAHDKAVREQWATVTLHSPMNSRIVSSGAPLTNEVMGVLENA